MPSARIAREVQPAIFVNEQGAQNERGLRFDGHPPQRLKRSFETLHEAPVALAQVSQIPAQPHQGAGGQVVGEIRIEDQRIGRQRRCGDPQGDFVCLRLGMCEHSVR